MSCAKKILLVKDVASLLAKTDLLCIYSVNFVSLIE